VIDQAGGGLPVLAGQSAAQMQDVARKGTGSQFDSLARGDQVILLPLLLPRARRAVQAGTGAGWLGPGLRYGRSRTGPPAVRAPSCAAAPAGAWRAWRGCGAPGSQ
jgi:hypothetical protein